MSGIGIGKGIGINNNPSCACSWSNGINDIDGNHYRTIYMKAGTYICEIMVDNLRTTRYNDGAAIPLLSLDTDWIAEDGTGGHDGARCWYNNDAGNVNLGMLYNYYAVVNTHHLSILGWEIPRTTHWEQLITEAGGISVVGGKWKERGLSYWNTPNTGAVDISCMGIRAGGKRLEDASFSSIGDEGLLWSRDYHTVDTSDSFSFFYNSIVAQFLFKNKKAGLSVRCLRWL